MPRSSHGLQHEHASTARYEEADAIQGIREHEKRVWIGMDASRMRSSLFRIIMAGQLVVADRSRILSIGTMLLSVYYL